jgi:tRNA dimethylallyltransferase
VKVIVIVGPTATGKTRLGVDVAHRLGSEILSADSRQVYTGLDLGTGKDLDEYRSVSPPVGCHLIDICDPRQTYTLFHFQQDCHRVMRELARDRRYGSGAVPLVMVGGTGLFVEAVVRGYRIADVPEDPGFRQGLRDRTHDELVARLAAQNPELHARTDVSSTRRVIRALEIAEASAKSPVLYSEPLGIEVGFTVFGVKTGRDTLRRRISRRVEARLGLGMVDEVQGLLDAGVSHERLHQLGLEYRAISAHLLGRTSHREMVEDLTRRIQQFSKRQMTYFRGMERRGIEIHWIGPNDSDVIFEAAGKQRPR